MTDKPMTDDELAAVLVELPGWTRDGDALAKTFTFDNFPAALSFMVRVGFEAERLDHHPEWTNVYNTVKVRLTTHHAGNRITAKDIELGRRMEKVRELPAK